MYLYTGIMPNIRIKGVPRLLRLIQDFWHHTLDASSKCSGELV